MKAILWGVHDVYLNGKPLKICLYSKAEHTRREKLGWKCEKVPTGQKPKTLG